MKTEAINGSPAEIQLTIQSHFLLVEVVRNWKSGRVRCGINLDPVVSNRRPHLFTGGLGHDDVSGFDRHVTIDAIGRNFMPHGFGHSAALPLMAGKASVGI